MKRVTIVGAGFAGLTAVRKLRAFDPRMEITLVAPKPEFSYMPGTIWIPSGLRRPEDLLLRLENFFQRMKVNYVKASATGLKDGGRTVRAGVALFNNQADVDRLLEVSAGWV